MSLLVSSFQIKNRTIKLVRSSLDCEKDSYWIQISIKNGLSFANCSTHITLFYPKYHAYCIYARMIGCLLSNDYYYAVS